MQLRNFREGLTSYYPPLIIFIVEISARVSVPLFRPESVHSGSASWDDCERAFPDDFAFELVFLIGSYSMPGQCSQPLWVWLRCIKRVCVFRYNLPPALLAEWPGSLTCYSGITGAGRTQNKSQHKNVNTGEEKSPPVPTRNRTCDLPIMSPVLYPLSYLDPHPIIRLKEWLHSNSQCWRAGCWYLTTS